MSSIGSYKPRQFNLSGLKGISDQTLEVHFKLYEGYVKETNNLTEKISEFISDGNVDQEEMPAYSELTRRLGFEYNGMVLHEYYFDNLKSGGGIGQLEPDLLGEHHVAGAADVELIEGCLRWIEGELEADRLKRRQALLTVLQRAAQPKHGTGQWSHHSYRKHTGC